MDVEAKRMEKNALIDHLVAAQEIVRDTHADGILLGLISQAISRAQNEAYGFVLTPEQRAAVEMTTQGPALVTGAAGTGKSLVAACRVKWLRENVFTHGERILLTTFTTTLAHYMEDLLKKVLKCSSLPPQVEVAHFDRIVKDAWSRFRPGGEILYEQHELQRQGEIAAIIRDECMQTLFGGFYAGARSPEFLEDEYISVVLEHDVRDEASYLGAARPPTMPRIDKSEKLQLWPVFAYLNKCLAERPLKRLCRNAAMNLMAEAKRKGGFGGFSKYKAIVFDEAQDFGAAAYRFVGAITGNWQGVPPKPYTLYFCGDHAQQIYSRIGTFKGCGIDITNRSRRLSVNYRATRAIIDYAQRLVQGVEFPDLDAKGIHVGSDASALAEGCAPVERFFSNSAYVEENEQIAETIREWKESLDVDWGCFAVLIRNSDKMPGDGKVLSAKVRQLEELGLPVKQVDRWTAQLPTNMVPVMTMHRAKGLQFRGVAISLDDWPYYDANALSEDIRDAFLKREKCLLHMAIMRAQERVLLTSANKRPLELPRESCGQIPAPEGEND